MELTVSSVAMAWTCDTNIMQVNRANKKPSNTPRSTNTNTNGPGHSPSQPGVEDGKRVARHLKTVDEVHMYKLQKVTLLYLRYTYGTFQIFQLRNRHTTLPGTRFPKIKLHARVHLDGIQECPCHSHISTLGSPSHAYKWLSQHSLCTNCQYKLLL